MSKDSPAPATPVSPPERRAYPVLPPETAPPHHAGDVAPVISTKGTAVAHSEKDLVGTYDHQGAFVGKPLSLMVCLWMRRSHLLENALDVQAFRQGTPRIAQECGDASRRSLCTNPKCRIHVKGWSADKQLWCALMNLKTQLREASADEETRDVLNALKNEDEQSDYDSLDEFMGGEDEYQDEHQDEYEDEYEDDEDEDEDEGLCMKRVSR
jgi:hypothetical protein